MRFTPFAFFGTMDKIPPGTLQIDFGLNYGAGWVKDINLFSNSDIGFAGNSVNPNSVIGEGLSIFNSSGQWQNGVYRDLGRYAPTGGIITSLDRNNDGTYIIGNPATSWSAYAFPVSYITGLTKTVTITSGCTYSANNFGATNAPNYLRNTTNYGTVMTGVGGATGYYASVAFSGLTNPTRFNIQSDGKIVFCTSSGLKRYNTNGTIDTGFTSSITGQTNDVAFQSDGKLVAVGFGVTGGVTRLNSNGTYDTSFSGVTSGFDSTGLPGYDVWSVTIDSQDRAIVGVPSPTYNGVTIGGIVRLQQNGSIDTSSGFGVGFNGGLNDCGVYRVKIQPNDLLIVGGNFSGYKGQAVTCAVRLYT
jgi:hypothetical protein